MSQAVPALLEFCSETFGVLFRRLLPASVPHRISALLALATFLLGT